MRSCKVGLGRFNLTIPRHQEVHKKEVCNKNISAHNNIVAFYSCKTSTHRSHSDTTEWFRSIEKKKFPTGTNKNKPRYDLRDAKQQVGEIRSTYPCRSHSGNVQMNMVGIVVLASPPRDPIRSKRHNGWHLRVLHTYSATTTPPPQSSKVRWSGRWDQHHDGVMLMVESISGKGFAYAHEVEEK
jgi:hypothetical protein